MKGWWGNMARTDNPDMKRKSYNHLIGFIYRTGLQKMGSTNFRKQIIMTEKSMFWLFSNKTSLKGKIVASFVKISTALQTNWPLFVPSCRDGQ